MHSLKYVAPALFWGLLCLTPASAQDAPAPAPPPAAGVDSGTLQSPAPVVANYRTRTVLVFGNDPCPASTNPDEIIVCARRPEAERYRIPKKLRDEAREEKVRLQDNVGARRAEMVSGQNTSTGGTGSCSAIGGGGESGCTKGINVLEAGKTLIEGVKTATEPDD